MAMARNGADVVVADIIVENAEGVADEVRALGRRALAMSLDVANQESVDAMAAQALARFSAIDILVNNAGVIGARGWEERTAPNEEDWDFIFEINVKGIARVTDAIAPHMKERRHGKIVNIASIAGRQGSSRNPPYNVSKAGVISLTQAQAQELRAAQHQRERDMPWAVVDTDVGAHNRADADDAESGREDAV